jgi:phosphoribosyl 1,2-cyclic phosphate phosphodiesterase
MQLHFLGTGDARRVPVYGCDCGACRRARSQPQYRREACSALLEQDGFRLMIDAGRTDLCETFAPGSFDGVILTHYHMDHVMGLFHLRWGTGLIVPVYGPADPKGSDDLYKHPGIFDFRPGLEPFQAVDIGPFHVTPLPLNHSRVTRGYLFEAGGQSLAYLTDTAGLPADSLALLQRRPPQILVLDCSTPPKSQPLTHHNDLTLALELIEQIGPGQAYLTHVGHQLDAYWLNNPELPEGVADARDGLVVTPDPVSLP